MLNFNGKLLDNNLEFLDIQNRGLLYGDAVYEELRVVNGHIHFLEEHYLRLMSSMRILRMEIPMPFTMEFMEAEILKTIDTFQSSGAKCVKLLVYRDSKGTILPDKNTVAYVITVRDLKSPFFILDAQPYEVELFKDFYKSSNMLSTLNTNNTILNVVGSIFAAENDYDDCLLLNEQKSVVESLSGNLFLVNGTEIKTAPLSDGCLNGIVRKKLIEILSKLEEYSVKEESISPFELQKADELFIINSIEGIKSITKYRKKTYLNETAKKLVGKLNASARIEMNKN